jgi:hypothetical protein
MTQMNGFGIQQSDVQNKLTTGTYAPTIAELGGSAVVQDAIDDAVNLIIQAMPEEIFRQMHQIHLEMVCLRATAGQTTVQTTFRPIVPGQTWVWRGMPRFFRIEPHRSTDLLRDQEFFDDSGYRPLSELKVDTDYTLNDTTGVITFTNALMQNEQVAVDYWPDNTNAAFTIPSLANVAAHGAAAALATKLYPRASSQWDYVNTLTESFSNSLSSLQDKTWIPPEMRMMNFWKKILPDGDDRKRIQGARILRA